MLNSVYLRDLQPSAYGIWRPLLRQLDELLDQHVNVTAGNQEVWPSDFQPACELDETDDHYVMSFDVPGIHRDDLSIEVTGDRLVISGERKAEGRSAGRRYGKFQRVFTLPEGVSADGVVAEHKDGVLRLAIQKPAAAKPTKIKIADGTAQQRTGGFFRSLVSDRKSKDQVDIKKPSAMNESVAMAN